MSKINQSGFSSIIIFILFMGLFSILGLMFYNTQQAYVVACKRCQYYQVKYELEGLLNYAIRVAGDKQKDKEQVSPEVVMEISNWCILCNESYTAFIRLSHESEDSTAVFVELRSVDIKYRASCLVLCNVNSYEIINFSLV